MNAKDWTKMCRAEDLEVGECWRGFSRQLQRLKGLSHFEELSQRNYLEFDKGQ